MSAVPGSVWIFAYGSLIWDPGFAWTDRRLARVEGLRRSFCMRSIHHRGTPERPGLVLALDAAEGGGACEGLAFEIDRRIAEETLEYLRARELVSAAYLEAEHPVALSAGGVVRAVTYVIDRAHAQYCGGLPLEEQARIIATATGGRGPNADYLHRTAAGLTALGCPDPDLTWLSARVKMLQSNVMNGGMRRPTG
jgi:glutathione-specific gamma-glutamylcyclotransferase